MSICNALLSHANLFFWCYNPLSNISNSMGIALNYVFTMQLYDF